MLLTPPGLPNRPHTASPSPSSQQLGPHPGCCTAKRCHPTARTVHVRRTFMPMSSRMPTALPLHSHTSWSPRPRSLSLQVAIEQARENDECMSGMEAAADAAAEASKIKRAGQSAAAGHGAVVRGRGRGTSQQHKASSKKRVIAAQQMFHCAVDCPCKWLIQQHVQRRAAAARQRAVGVCRQCAAPHT